MSVERSIILVTGGAGFIGSHVTRGLLAEGHRGIVVDNLATGYAENIPPGAEFIEADISQTSVCESLPGDVDMVLHLAAQSSGPQSADIPAQDFDCNVRGTFNILQYCRYHGIRRFVHASSMSVYGNPDLDVVNEETPAVPLSYYGVSKLCAEKYVQHAILDGLEATTFRMFSVYGPGQDLSNRMQGMLSIFLSFITAGEDVVVMGSAERVRDFVYIDDVVAAWLDAVHAPGGTGVHNLGTGTATTVADLIAALVAATGNAPDYPLRYEAATPADQLGFVADTTGIRQALGWAPTVDLQTGIEQFVDSLE